MLRELAERPFEHVVPLGRAREALARQLLEVGELRQVHAVDGGIEARRRPDAGAKRLDGVLEPGVASEELRAGVPHFERRRRPPQRSVERWKPIVVHTGERAGERTGEIAAALEEMKRTGELPLTAHIPRFVLEEQ